ncbi:unnamed protein product [Alopecurus aequalis]
MDENVPATPPESIIVPASPQVEMQRQDVEISMDVPTDVNAPPPVEMQRQDGEGPSNEVVNAPASPRAYSKKLSIAYLRHHCQRVPVELRGLHDEVRDPQTYRDCVDTCLFFCCCHALASLLLSITFCFRCCTCMLKMPDRIEKRTARTHKLVAFLAKNLTTLWVSFLLILFARWVLFRPINIKPLLATSTVNQFELQPPGLLRFNVTAYVLFHNGHKYNKIRYNYFVGTVLYADVKLGPADDEELPPFTQKPHENILKRLPFAGRLRNATGTVEETFARERLEGQLQMVVRIRVLLNYGFWPFKGDYFTVYDCPLVSPFPQMGDPGISPPARCNSVHF